MSINLPFPLGQFYEALNQQNPKEKLEYFIGQFRKKNIFYIYECINRLIQIITNQSEPPLMKFNSLMAARYFFDTCQYPAITLIQVFVLPYVYQIGLQKYLKRSQEGMELYFVDRGAENTKENRRIGLSYVQLAAELVFNWAKVKPYRLIQNRELVEQSNFVRTKKIFNSKGIVEPWKCTYFIPSYSGYTRAKFLKKLKHFAPQPYISFMTTQFLEEINLNKKSDLEIKKLFLFGDSFLTSTMVEIIDQQLSNMSQNFMNKRKYLSLLCDLVRSGQIESIYLLNSSQFLGDIASQIQKVKGDLNMNQGQYIYSKIEASRQQKKQFYIQFLRCIQIWAFCIPTTDQGQDSQSVKILKSLKNKKFIFPKNVLLQKIKKQMEQNLSINQERNDVLLKIIDNQEPLFDRSAGSYVAGKGQYKYQFPNFVQKFDFLQFEQLQNRVFQAKKKLARIGLKQSEIKPNYKHLMEFTQNWDQNLQKLDIQDQDPNQLQLLVDQGDICCQKFNQVIPYYNKYNSKQISFQQFAKQMQFLQKKQQQQEQNNNQQQHSKQDFFSSDYVKKASVVKKSNISIPYSQKPSGNQKQSHISGNQNDLSRSVNSVRDTIAAKLKSNNNTKIDKMLENQKALYQQKVSMKNDHQIISNKPKNKNEQILKNKEAQISTKNTPLKMNDTPSHKNHKQQNYSQVSSSLNEQQVNFDKHKQKHKQTINTNYQPKKPSLIKEKQIYQNHHQNQQQDNGSLRSSPQSSKNKHHKSKKSKSIIRHSVISKNSYRSQPTENKLESNQYMDNSKYDSKQLKGSMIEKGNNQYDLQNQHYSKHHTGNKMKKSSIKKTQNSNVRNHQTQQYNKQQLHKLQLQYINTGEQNQNITKGITTQNQRQQEKAFKKKNILFDSNHSSNKSNSQLKSKEKQKSKFNNQNTHNIYSMNTYAQIPKVDNSRAAYLKESLKPVDNYSSVFNTKKQSFQPESSDISSQGSSIIQSRQHKLRLSSSKNNFNKSKDKFYCNSPNKESFNNLSNSRQIRLHAQEYYNDGSENHYSQMSNSKKDPNRSSHGQGCMKQSKNSLSRSRSKQQNKIKQIQNKISNMALNSKQKPYNKGSGVKLMSNQDRNFDSLYSKAEVPEQYEIPHNMKSSKKQKQLYRRRDQSQISQQYQLTPSQFQRGYDSKQIMTHHRKGPQIDQIRAPQNMPVLLSYYSNDGYQQDNKYMDKTAGPITDFRSCYINMENQILPIQESKTKAVSASFSSQGKMYNFLENRSTAKSSRIADALSQKNTKNSILLYKLQRQKNRLVQNLQNKIKSLEKNGKMMKTKLAIGSNNKNSRPYENMSERQLKVHSIGMKSSRLSSERDFSVANEMFKRKGHHTKSPYENSIDSQQYNQPNININRAIKTQQNLNGNQGFNKRNVKFSLYEHYFPRQQSVNKKIFYKNKGSLIKNSQLQIDYVLNCTEHIILNITIFITPLKSDINDVQLKIKHDSNLGSLIKHSHIPKIKSKRQQPCTIKLTIESIPFQMPLFNIKFATNQQYSCNSYSFPLPCSFMNFCNLKIKNTYDSQNIKQGQQKFISEEFNIDKKWNNCDKIVKLFPNSKRVSSNPDCQSLSFEIQYKDNKFLGIIKIHYKRKTILQIQKVVQSISQDTKGNIKELQFLIASIQYILQQVNE